ncbi:hypothetical protein [Methylobacterium nodulans]|uniref:Uncharacterized protein n=1 Tax=Methylobacterium nodulans (strain LMG 21967 / CNCM I-2342 / ORS 2060) TaxID=460265 RepID=B8IDX9_METNO|nr:hypothetical protein [Methylobacterium nodulans]ACL55701.1 conserved hypothetical protein [Methylobacterium nodulans ORS 2060]
MNKRQLSGRATAAGLVVLAGILAAACGRAAAQSDLEGPPPAEEPVLSKPYRSSVPQFRRRQSDPWREPPGRDAATRDAAAARDAPARDAASRDAAAEPAAAQPPRAIAAPAAEAPAPEPRRPVRVIPVPPAQPAAAAPPAPRPDEDEPEEAPTVTYVGIWGPTAAACSGRRARRLGYLPAVIRDDAARAGKTSCTFRDTKRTGNSWTMAATCRNARQRWTSHVRLSVDGDRLTWSSERGAAVYVRCPKA